MGSIAFLGCRDFSHAQGVVEMTARRRTEWNREGISTVPHASGVRWTFLRESGWAQERPGLRVTPQERCNEENPAPAAQESDGG